MASGCVNCFGSSFGAADSKFFVVAGLCGGPDRPASTQLMRHVAFCAHAADGTTYVLCSCAERSETLLEGVKGYAASVLPPLQQRNTLSAVR